MSENMAYNIYNYKNNYMLIFNHEKVVGQLDRTGTDKDEKVLDKTFTDFGFEVEVVPDPTKEKTMQSLEEFFKRDFRDCGCVIVAVFTHGDNNTILYASDGQWYDIKDILKHFDHEDLVDKPKILFVQACRGDESTAGFHVPSTTLAKDAGPAVTHNIMPNDVLIVHSTSKNKASHRVEGNGSWFIQTLCEVLSEQSDQDLVSNLVDLKRKIAIDYDEAPYYYNTRYAPNFSAQLPPSAKQVPETTSTLTKCVYFKKTEKPVLARDTRVKYAPSTSFEIARDSVVKPNREYVRRYSGVRIVDHIQAGSSKSTDAHNQYYSYINNCLGYYLQANPEDEFAQYLSQIWTERKEAISLWSNLVSEYLSTKKLDFFYPCTFVIYGDGLEYFLQM